MTAFDAPISLPEPYRQVVAPLTNRAQKLLEEGELFQPLAFIANLSTEQFVPMVIDTDSAQAKEDSAHAIRSAADALGADLVFVLKRKNTADAQEFRDSFGTLVDMPEAVDVVEIRIETPVGNWAAQVSIVAKGQHTPRRIISAVRLRRVAALEGPFSDLLPVRLPNATLH